MIEPFERKIWLSSPTMHGDEMKYVAEAYETNWMSTVGKNIDETERAPCRTGRRALRRRIINGNGGAPPCRKACRRGRVRSSRYRQGRAERQKGLLL